MRFASALPTSTRRTGCHATTYTAAALERCRISSILTGALEIKAAHGFSYWDSAIIAAARALGCRILYSEDMSHGREVEGITIVDPFR